MEREFILNQAYEEGRYYRNFHHVIYTLFMTLYLAFLGVQISVPASIETIRSQIWLSIIIGICIFLLIPKYVCYIIINYHKKIAYLHSLIANIAVLPDDIASHMKNNKSLTEAFDTLLFAKYRGIIANGHSPVRTGHGHWFFIITFVLLVVCNFIVFVLVHASTS